MAYSVQPTQPVDPQSQVGQTAQQPAPKPQQTAKSSSNATPQDTVTISQQAKQASANTSKPTSGDTDHDGDSK